MHESVPLVSVIFLRKRCTPADKFDGGFKEGSVETPGTTVQVVVPSKRCSHWYAKVDVEILAVGTEAAIVAGVSPIQTV